MRMTQLIHLARILLSVSLAASCEAKKDAEAADQAPSPESQAPAPQIIQNLAALTAGLNTDPYREQNFRGQNVTIAVLDNGFDGIQDSLGTTLPPDVTVEKPANSQPVATFHGTRMAEIAYAVASGSVRYRPEVAGPSMRLYVTSGPYENLERAVDQLIALKQANPLRNVIALYSQVWEFGGNGDGRGYINLLVNRAVDAGVLWVNAAGNLGQSAYSAPIVIGAQKHLRLPFEDYYIRFRVVAPSAAVRLVLGWGDFTDSYYFYRTSQDLDLVLESDDKKPLGAGRLIQDGQDHANALGYSRHARELIQANLNQGLYRLRVIANSANFDPNERFWIAASGDGVMLDNANGDDLVFVPADNPRVLTVGAQDIEYGNGRHNLAGQRLKPECLTTSHIVYTDGSEAEGTSTAAAAATGALAVLSSAYGPLTKTFIDKGLQDGLFGFPAQQIGQPLDAKVLRLPAPDRLRTLR